MRFALIVALVSCVFLTTERAEARPDKTTKVQKKKQTKAVAKAKALAKAKPAKKVVEEEEAPVVRDEEEKPKIATPTPKRSGSPVRQASDDEVPRNERPSRKR